MKTYSFDQVYVLVRAKALHFGVGLEPIALLLR